MEYEFDEKQLKLVSINFSDEIVGDDEFLKNDDVTILNSSILQLKGSDDLLIASRGWYGNIRSWDGTNFIVMSLFDKEFNKKKQKILNIDLKSLKDKKKKFKEFKEDQKKIITHGEKQIKGSEDPRLFYLNDDIYILFNGLNSEDKRHMFVGKVNLNKLEYSKPIELCESLSTRFEKNWGPFIYQKKLHMIYDINPVTIFELEDNFKCKLKFRNKNEILETFTSRFPDLKFHIRNSTNLIALNGNEYLGLGHGVLEYKKHTDINKYLTPLIGKSNYSDSDKAYFERFWKLYTGFFYKLDMKKQEIIQMSPFFQLPNYESKQELIFFPTSISLDSDNYINISYNVGDTRSYFMKLYLDIINVSLYDTENIDFLVNLNINVNYYTELVRNIRKMMGFSTKKKDYYIFGDVNKIFTSSDKARKGSAKIQKRKDTKHKTKTKKITKRSKKTTRKKKDKMKKLIYFYKENCSWCSKFEKTWNKLKKNKNIKFMKVNGPKNKKMNEKFNIEYYPTLILLENEKEPTMYEGERNYKSLRKFIS